MFSFFDQKVNSLSKIERTKQKLVTGDSNILENNLFNTPMIVGRDSARQKFKERRITNIAVQSLPDYRDSFSEIFGTSSGSLNLNQSDFTDLIIGAIRRN